MLKYNDNNGVEGGNMLAQETERVLKERGWSLRRAEIQTGIGFTTVGNMRLGKNVEPEALIKWAEAISEDPNVWLAAAGKPFRIPDSLPEQTVLLPSGHVVKIFRPDGDDPTPISDADIATLTARIKFREDVAKSN